MATPIQGTSYGTGWVDVCNWALRRIGAPRISTLNDGSTQQIACTDLLGQSISEVIAANDDWACLRARAQLSRDASYTPPNDFKYAYLLPSDYEGFVAIETLDAPAPQLDPLNPRPLQPVYPWSPQGNWILTSATLVYLTYTRTPTNEDGATLPKKFRWAVAMQLALNLVMPLRQNVQLQKIMEGVAKGAIKQAIASDDQAKQTFVGPEERGFGYYDEVRSMGQSDRWY